MEMAVTTRCHLRSVEIKITKPTKISVDNNSASLNAANLTSSLNKKMIALAHHSIVDRQSENVRDTCQMKSQGNLVDCLTKALNSILLRKSAV